jgi:hypothetical protein
VGFPNETQKDKKAHDSLPKAVSALNQNKEKSFYEVYLHGILLPKFYHKMQIQNKGFITFYA